MTLPSLTSLRFAAAFAVYANHSLFLFEGTSAERVMSNLSIPGATGVDFFFVLSGFVLAWSARPGDTAKAFYRRRIARIVPVYLLVTLAALVVTAGFLKVGAISLTLLQSWVPDEDVYYGAGEVNWSLSTEAFFYLLAPALLLASARMDGRRLLLAAGLTIIACWTLPAVVRAPGTVGTDFWAIYIFPPARLAEFLFGVLLCRLLRSGFRLPLPVPVWGAVAAAAYLYAGHVPVYLGWYAITVVPFGLLILACAQRDLDGPSHLLHDPRLQLLGHISYAFYLIHPVVWLVSRPDSDLLGGAVLWTGALLLTVGLSYLVYRFVERPLELRIRGPRTPLPADGRVSG